MKAKEDKNLDLHWSDSSYGALMRDLTRAVVALASLKCVPWSAGIPILHGAMP